jgi:hypothetical protein
MALGYFETFLYLAKTYFSPADATQWPLLLICRESIVKYGRTVDWNQMPSHSAGNWQPGTEVVISGLFSPKNL